MTTRIDGTQGNFDNPKRIVHTLTPEEKKAGSVFTRNEGKKQGYNGKIPEFVFTYKDLNNDGIITENELQSKKQYDEKGNLIQDNFYKDVNNDGILDLYSVIKYSYNDNDTAAADRYTDKNGDGYSDEQTHYEYDKNRQITSKETKTEADINSVKNRNPLASEIENRKMDRLDSGVSVKSSSNDNLAKTKAFKDSLMKTLRIESSQNPRKSEFYLDRLIVDLQTVNGSIKNNLRNKIMSSKDLTMFDRRFKEMLRHIQDATGYVGDIEIVQNPKTGLYQVKIGEEIIDVPERRVVLKSIDTEDGPELLPEIED